MIAAYIVSIRSAQVRHAVTNTMTHWHTSYIHDQRVLHTEPFVSSTMSTLQYLCELFNCRASQLTPPPPPPPGPSTASPTSPPEAPEALAANSAFGNFIDGVGTPQTAETVYNDSKVLLDVIDKVGYAVPALKAAAVGIRRIMTVVDVCISQRLAITMLELSTLPRVRM